MTGTKKYKICKTYIIDPRGCKIYNDIKKHPLLLLNTKKGQIYNVYSVGLSSNSMPFVTIEINMRINCVRLPKDLTEWVKCMMNLQSKNKVKLFPHNVKFGMTTSKEHYAQFID